MKWQVRTTVMFIAMSLILAAMGMLFGWYFGEIWYGLIAMLALSVVFNLYAYFFSKNGALRANKAHIITEAEDPRLYGIVRRVSEKAGVPMPEVGISEFAMPNAFATGRNPKNAAVVATIGILALLPDDELEGVIAHEIAHVKNRDILVMSVASTMAAILSFLGRWAFWLAFSGRERNAYMMLIGIVASITIPIASVIVQLGISRSREYLADETGARITGNPRALARALQSIESGVRSPNNTYDNVGYESMWISNPVARKNVFRRLFSTHPPMDDRVARLIDLAAKMDSEQAPRQTDPFNKKNNRPY